MTENPQSKESLAWDRVGQFLQNTGTMGERIWRRCLNVWGNVADHMGSGRYSADAMAADTASAMVAIQKSLEDVWTTMARPPERQRYVDTLPTAFLFFDRPKEKEDVHTLLDPVIIPVAPNDDRQLPATALIALNGTSSESEKDPDKTSERGVDALLSRLTVRLDDNRRYVLETVELAGKSASGLVAGVYDGLVYLKDPPLALANVRVIVEGPPPTV
jgi:hypothetical protein